MNSKKYYSYPYIKNGKLKSDFVESKDEARRLTVQVVHEVGELQERGLISLDLVNELLNQLEMFEIQEVLPEIVLDLRKESDHV